MLQAEQKTKQQLASQEKKSNINKHSNKKEHFLSKFFKIKENNSTIQTEILAGLTTFITMSYIIFVNSAFLADAGIPRSAAIGATIIASALASIGMGLYANLPIALAPGMGLNAYFAYTIVNQMGVPWQTALGAVFLSGLIFFFLTVTRCRQMIIKAIPPFLRSAIVIGIGLFISLIGLKNAGIVVSNQNTMVGLGDLGNPATLIAVITTVLTAALVTKKIKGSFLIGIFVATIAGMVFHVGDAQFPTGLSAIFGTPPSISGSFLKLDIFSAIGLGIFNIVFCFTLVDLFDSLGTFMGLSKKIGLEEKSNIAKNMDKALHCDAVASIAGSMLGTCTTTAYIESASGIEEGGKTGLTAVTVGVLFLMALFFTPLIALVPSYATAPVLIIVGMLMLEEFANLNFNDFGELFPAFIIIALIPLTFSINQGISLGIIAYGLMSLLLGTHKKIHPVIYVLIALFLIQFAFFKI